MGCKSKSKYSAKVYFYKKSFSNKYSLLKNDSSNKLLGRIVRFFRSSFKSETFHFLSIPSFGYIEIRNL
jgi:hypothetical protein